MGVEIKVFCDNCKANLKDDCNHLRMSHRSLDDGLCTFCHIYCLVEWLDKKNLLKHITTTNGEKNDQ